MNIARPRLLVGSLAVAVLIVAVFAVVVANRGGDDGVDATLTDFQEPIAQPSLIANQAVEGTPLPLVTVGDRDGNEIETASFLGSPLVINLWYSTCGPCAKELPAFAQVQAERGDEVRFIGVNPQDSVEVMERFAKDKGVRYELYRDELAEFTDAIGAVNFPITLFVDADGGIVDQTGPLDADELNSRIDDLLSGST